MSPIQRVMRTLFAGSICFLLSYFFPLVETYWGFLVACLLVQLQIEDTLQKNLLLMTTCIFLIAINVWIISQLIFFPLLAVYLSLVTFLCLYVGLIQRQLLIPAFFVNLFAGLAMGENNMTLVFAHLEWVFLGGLVALGVSLLTSPYSLKQKIYGRIKKIQTSLDELQKLIFSMYTQRNYEQYKVFYEQALHYQSKKVFDSLVCLEVLIQHAKTPPFAEKKWAELKKIFELTMELASLRYRIRDQSTFEVCEKELQAVAQSLSLALKKKDYLSFEESIYKFENVFNTTLQVVSKQPVLFLIFIKTLYQIHEEFLRWQESTAVS